MRINANELPIVFQAGDATIRATDWDALRALLISLPAGTDAAPLLQGLPEDRCQCPHWGYVRKGDLTVNYANTSETFREGDMYYMPPGHTIVAKNDVELIEFSPPRGYDEVLDAMRRNLGA
jgi:hypothetical protein